MPKNDGQLKQDVEAELRNDPRINATQIAVSVDDGMVSLLGAVDTYVEKWAAEKAARRVSGVRTVAQDLTVKLLTEHRHSDTEIAVAIQRMLDWNVFVPRSVTARVERGAVTLDGHAVWNYQREAAENAVGAVMGVAAVLNNISLKPDTSAAHLKDNILSSLQRHAMDDAKTILIETDGGKVTLRGKARSWSSIEDAMTVAWAAPGVTQVDNQVMLSPMF